MKSQFSDKVNFIFAIANLLRGPYKPNQYGKVVLPMTVLRRLDCVLAPTRAKVLDAAAKHKDKPDEAREKILNKVAGQQFHNTSKLDFTSLAADPNNLAANLTKYMQSFSPKARTILDHFKFHEQIEKLDKANRLYLIMQEFAKIDFHPNRVPPQEMGYIFEDLIRKYNEDANETAGDHFTPREVIHLMVNILFTGDGDRLIKKGFAPSIYDPTCGTGGMLATAEDYLHEYYPDTRPEIFGQDYNDESYAICGSDMLVKGHSIEHIVFGDVLGDGETEDGFPREKFDYMLANPPFGVEWKPEKDKVEAEHANDGYAGRFGAGTPRINDGSFLFLQHMLSKRKDTDKNGSRIAIVFNGSPLFTGDAGSGESEIRRWIIENDWLDAIIALPNQLFYNTGIFTYIWIVTNRKAAHRTGKVQLINAVEFYLKMRKSLGDKRNRIGEPTEDEPNLPDHIAELTQVYGEFKHEDSRTVQSNGDTKTVIASKIFDNTDFAYRKITIERPLRLKFQVTVEGIEALREITAFRNLAVSKKKDKKAKAAAETEGTTQQDQIVELLQSLELNHIWMDRKEFLKDLAAACKKSSPATTLSAPLKKAIVKALGERDDNAAICLDKDGHPEADTDLRDYEYVPFAEDIDTYFAREVQPFVADAWIDRTKLDHKDGLVGLVGYEIPLNRHFYIYQPPRPLNEIEAEIAALETAIITELRQVIAS